MPLYNLQYSVNSAPLGVYRTVELSLSEKLVEARCVRDGEDRSIPKQDIRVRVSYICIVRSVCHPFSQIRGKAILVPYFACLQVMGVMDVMFDRKNGMSLTERPKALAGKLGELWEMILDVSENLPPATLRWRIQNWLSVGQGRVERGLGDMKASFAVELFLVLLYKYEFKSTFCSARRARQPLATMCPRASTTLRFLSLCS